MPNNTPNSAPNPFEEGAKSVSNIPVIFIDPDDFKDDSNKEQKLHTVEKSIQTQFQKHFPDSDSNINVNKLALSTDSLVSSGPGAAAITINGQKVCVITKPGADMDTKEEVAETLSGTPSNIRREVPGTDADWQRGAGVHEGVHCNQAGTYNLHKTILSEEDMAARTLRHEAEADSVALQDMEQRGKPEVAEAWKNYRSLGRVNENLHPNHATGAILGNIEPGDATTNHVNAAHVTTNLLSQHQDDFVNNPDQYIETVEKAIAHPENIEGIGEAGGIKDIDDASGDAIMEDITPEVKTALQTHLDAYRQEVLPRAQASKIEDIKGGQPEIIQGDIKDTMEIGGVKASSFFNSHSDPGAAQQRLDQQAKLDVGVNNEANLTAQNNQPSMAPAPVTPMTI